LRLLFHLVLQPFDALLQFVVEPQQFIPTLSDVSR
jgi:hypothetical protein